MTEDNLAAEPVRTSIAPWLSVSDGPSALDYYTAAFGAVERYRLEDDAGRVVIARLAIDQAEFWLQEDPDSSPDPGGGPIRMILTVADPASVFRRAVEAGRSEEHTSELQSRPHLVCRLLLEKKKKKKIKNHLSKKKTKKKKKKKKKKIK